MGQEIPAEFKETCPHLLRPAGEKGGREMECQSALKAGKYRLV